MGSRLDPKLGVRVRPTTLLRCLRTMSPPLVETVQVLRLDDWAFKRGKTYGAILVDLVQHRVIDLEPDSIAEKVKSWLSCLYSLERSSPPHNNDSSSTCAR